MANLLPGTPVVGETFSPGGRTVNGILIDPTVTRNGILVSVMDEQCGNRKMYLVDLRVDGPAAAKLVASLQPTSRRERDCDTCQGSGFNTVLKCDCDTCQGTGSVES